MLLSEIFNTDDELIYEAKIAWARQGGKLVRKFRCSSGPRKGRVVSSPVDCGKPFDLKKRQRFKVTRASRGTRMAAKAQRTKQRDPVSIRVKKLNQ